MRLIDADEFFENFPELAIEPYINAQTVEGEILTEEAYSDLCLRASRERPQGKWVFRQGVTCGGYYKCNKCGEVERAEKNFCPNCGADMRGREK